MHSYPSYLPPPLKSDRDFQIVDPMVSTPYDSGQTRWDRQFTDVPTATPVSWILTDAQCAIFRTWYANVLNWGVDWFEMPLTADDGQELRECHFVKGYSGPTRLGFDRWKISANLVLRRLPEIDPEWIEVPEYWDPVARGIFDLAMTTLWPVWPYDGASDGAIFDTAMTTYWPEEAI